MVSISLITLIILHSLYIHPGKVVQVSGDVVGAVGDGGRELEHRMSSWVVPVRHHLHVAGLRVAAKTDTGLVKQDKRRKTMNEFAQIYH